MAKPYFYERSDQFWEWFAANEDELSRLYDNPDGTDWQEVVRLAQSGVTLVSDRLHFVIGGDHEFSFTAAGCRPLFFLLPHLVANQPQPSRTRWTFNASLSGLPGAEVALSIHGAEVSADQVWVKATPDLGGATATIGFFADGWPFDERQSMQAFYTLLDLVVGESLAGFFISGVEQVDTPTDDMLALAELKGWMLDNLFNGGEPPSPAEMRFTYQREPSDGLGLDGARGLTPAVDGAYEGVASIDDGCDQPIVGLQPRFDIIAGKASAHPLLTEYYNGVDTSYHDFVSWGAKPVFVFYEHGGSEFAVAERNSLIERIVSEVLGGPGQEHELGVLLGTAVGLSCCYIDLLLFDERTCLLGIADLVADFACPVFAKEFRLDGVAFSLNDKAEGLVSAQVGMPVRR